jgi:hypothetical protein
MRGMIPPYPSLKRKGREGVGRAEIKGQLELSVIETAWVHIQKLIKGA